MLAARFAGLLPPMSGEEALESAALASLGSEAFALKTGNSARSALRTTRLPASRWSAGAAIRAPARYRWRTTACCSWTSCRIRPQGARSPARTARVRPRRHFARRAPGRVSGALPADRRDEPLSCGYLGHFSGKCRCTPDQVARYRHKLSGPLLDRIDISVEVCPMASNSVSTGHGVSSEHTDHVADIIQRRALTASFRRRYSGRYRSHLTGQYRHATHRYRHPTRETSKQTLQAIRPRRALPVDLRHRSQVLAL